MSLIGFGPQICGDLEAASAREWLVTDGLGGYAMGTVGTLLTRRYHGLLVVSAENYVRHVGLVALDPVVVIGDRRVELATHEWMGGSVAPRGHRLLAAFSLDHGVPRWVWQIGSTVIERRLAMLPRRSAVGISHRVVRAPEPVRLELTALCTWRDAHGERTAGSDPAIEVTGDGFVFEAAYRVRGPAFAPTGSWYRGVHHRDEAARGLNADEDVWCAGTFAATVAPGESMDVEAWAQTDAAPPPPARRIIETATSRALTIEGPAGGDPITAELHRAADQFVVDGDRGADVIAGYPWFGAWSRDTMTSYEGLFLMTRRVDEGRALLRRSAASVSEGMLANTTDGTLEYNTVDAALWFIHAVSRHSAVDLDLAAELEPTLRRIVEAYRRGTRFGIRADSDGLITQGSPGWALTWMDARVDGQPITARSGKPVEVNALWCNALGSLADLQQRIKLDNSATVAMHSQAKASFLNRFGADGATPDVIDGPAGDDHAVRPNQFLAHSLPFGPRRGTAIGADASALLTALGPRSLAVGDQAYVGRHRGSSAERDRAYHQGTVWPWLIGSYVEAERSAGRLPLGVLEGLNAHLSEHGLGSVSETADADAPHEATGCPFQAWSVAELLRAHTLLAQ